MNFIFLKVYKRALLLTFALAGVFSQFIGCSSSDNAAVLPSSELDSVEPALISVVPRIQESNEVEPNTVFRFDFDEQLDLNSLRNGVLIYANKLRDIFSTASDSSKYIVSNLDAREVSLATEDRLITVVESIVIGEEEDDDGVVTEITTDAEREVFATRVAVSAGSGRFALASRYSIIFDESVKDRSEIESVDPTTSLISQGNFLSGELTFKFSTSDGALGPTKALNTSYQYGSNVVGDSSFESLPEMGYILWKQLFSSTSGDNSSAIFYKPFDYGTQQFFQVSDRFDYISELDSSTDGVESSVLDFSSDSSGIVACATWSNQDTKVAPLQQSVMLRCGDGEDWGARVILNTHLAGPAVLSLNALMLNENSVLVTYVYDGLQYIYLSSLNDRGVNLVVQDSSTFGSAAFNIRDVALASVSNANGLVTVIGLVSLTDSAAPASQRYKIYSSELVLDSGAISLVATEVDNGPSIFGQLSIGLDRFGTGFGGWLKGAGNERRLFTSRFDGQLWQTPVGVSKDGRGPITEGAIYVYDDGQSVFYWLQDIGSQKLLKVQGAYSVGGGAGLGRPSPLVVDSTGDNFSSLRFSGDQEGNGVLYYGLQGSILYSVRFLHNVAWDQAWGSPEFVANEVEVDSSAVGQILEDGRMVFSYPVTQAPYGVLEARIFSDYQ